jgi:hypothetical protein
MGGRRAAILARNLGARARVPDGVDIQEFFSLAQDPVDDVLPVQFAVRHHYFIDNVIWKVRNRVVQ